MRQAVRRSGLTVVRGDAPPAVPLSDIEVARRIDREWRAGYLGMARDLSARPHQCFHDVGSPSKERRPWAGLQRAADRVQSAGGSVETIRAELHATVDRVCDLMRRRDRRHWCVDDNPRAA